ncbi:restriction endonuclease, partial [Pseudomonas syringae pv. actinidifoliorum]|nr:restriction endonuclease [Pseudomonas syringae pv. actinidifoliorum]
FMRRLQKVFQLRPDLMITQGEKSWVLDTKWKRLDSEMGRKNYGLSQADFYQLFAYGQKYLGGQGDLVLIYPKRASFQEALPIFEFSEGLRLWVVPFDLELRRILAIVGVRGHP